MWPQNIKAILFDMDGTLVDSENIHFQNIVRICKDYGYKFTEKDDEDFLGTSMTYIFENIKGRFSKPMTFEEFAEQNISLFGQIVNKEHLFPGVKEALDYLKEKEIPLSVVTNGEEAAAKVALTKTEIWDYFDHVITASHVTKAKPHPEPYLKAAALLNVDIKDCLIIEDNPTGIESGIKAGGYVVAIKTSVPMEKLKQAHKTVEKFAEIPFKKLF